jgi:RimJ/RimL family protein N-acetyltransferase
MKVKVITDEPKRVTEWASKYLENQPSLDSTQAFGFELKGKLIGAVVFTDYSKNDIHVSVVSKNPILWQRRYLKVMYDYVWNQCGCLRISAMASEVNHKSRKLLEKLGFKEEGRLRNFHGEHDGIVYGQLRSECKWI